jgi:hypothetical protein
MGKSEFILYFLNHHLVVLIQPDGDVFAVENKKNLNKSKIWHIPLDWYESAVETYEQRIWN